MAPLAASPVGATKAPKHKAVKPKGTTKSLAGGCTALNGEESQSSRLETSLESAFASGNFATIKAAVLSEFTLLNTSIAKGKGLLGSAPANVRTAFGTIAGFFVQLRSQIQATTTLPQLEQVFESLGTNPKVISADKVLATYYGSKCGVTTTTVTTA
jgi:hypothetical protein